MCSLKIRAKRTLPEPEKGDGVNAVPLKIANTRLMGLCYPAFILGPSGQLRKDMPMKRISLFATLWLLAFSMIPVMPVQAQRLTRVQFADGSGTIGLAPGWKIINAGNGAVQAQGSNGAVIMLGIPFGVVSKDVEAQFPDIPGSQLFPGSPRVDFSDATRAALDMMRFNAQHSSGAIRNIKLRAVEPAPMPNGKAVFIRYAATLNGKPSELFGLYAIMPLDNTQGMFYSSTVAAPRVVYAKTLPTMMAMWASWSLSNATIRKRLQDAAKALGEVDVQGITDSVLSYRRDVAIKAARDFQEYLRQ